MGGVAPIFEYRFQPNQERNSDTDGGFSVSCWDDDTLTFLQFNTLNVIVYRQDFQLQHGTSTSIRNILQANSYWLRALQRRKLLRLNAPDPTYWTYTYLENLDDYLEMNDVHQMMRMPFRSYNAHYSRLYYSMIEDFSAVLYRIGFDFHIQRLRWDPAFVQMIPPPDRTPPKDNTGAFWQNFA